MAAKTRRLSIVFPGIFDLIANQDFSSFAREFPFLARLIDRGSIEDDEALDLDRAILTCFGIDLAERGRFNSVELSAEVDGVPFSDRLVRADPVHLRADGTQLRLFSGPYFEPDAEESASLLAELRPLFPEYKFYCGRFPGRWYIEFPGKVQFEAASITAIQQLAIEGRLPTGENAKKAHVLMNEMQMALHQSDVNREREANGMAPINSIWLWGLGPSLETRNGGGLSVWGDDVMSQAVAQRCGTEIIQGDTHLSDASQVLEYPWRHGRKLVLINHPTGPIEARNEPVDLAAFEQTWAAPLFKSLRYGQLKCLELIDVRRRLKVGALDTWKIWRRSSYFAERLKVDIDPTKLSRDISIDDA